MFLRLCVPFSLFFCINTFVNAQTPATTPTPSTLNLLREISDLVQDTRQKINLNVEIAHIRQIFNALERSPNPEKVTAFLSQLDKSQRNLEIFYTEMQNILHSDPVRFNRLKLALEQAHTIQSREKIILPSFSRVWAGFGILLSTSDYFFSNYFVMNELGGLDISAYTAMTFKCLSFALGSLGVGVLADFLLIKKSAAPLYQDMKQHRQTKAFIQDVLDLTHRKSGLNNQITSYLAVAGAEKMASQNLAESLKSLFDLSDSLENTKLKNHQLILRLQKYLATRRIQKVIHEVSSSLTPIEIRELNQHLTLLGNQHSLPFNQKILYLQEALMTDLQAWEKSHPDNNISNLLNESIAAEKSIKRDKLIRLKPHTLAALNYAAIGFVLTLASDAATVGLSALPFDTSISLFLRNNREMITFYSAITGILTTVAHILYYPKIRKWEYSTSDSTLQSLRPYNSKAWNFFRRTAILSQWDYRTIASKENIENFGSHNAWSFMRKILSYPEYRASLLEYQSEKPSCESTLPSL